MSGHLLPALRLPQWMAAVLWAVVLTTMLGCGETGRYCRVDADPNPVMRCLSRPPAASHLGWFCEGIGVAVELRIGDPEGQLFAEGGPHGHLRTGPWLAQPTTFFLVEKSSRELLAETTVEVESRPCPPES